MAKRLFTHQLKAGDVLLGAGYPQERVLEVTPDAKGGVVWRVDVLRTLDGGKTVPTWFLSGMAAYHKVVR